jgi:hypothetical protein
VGWIARRLPTRFFHARGRAWRLTVAAAWTGDGSRRNPLVEGDARLKLRVDAVEQVLSGCRSVVSTYEWSMGNNGRRWKNHVGHGRWWRPPSSIYHCDSAIPYFMSTETPYTPSITATLSARRSVTDGPGFHAIDRRRHKSPQSATDADTPACLPSTRASRHDADIARAQVTPRPRQGIQAFVGCLAGGRPIGCLV